MRHVPTRLDKIKGSNHAPNQPQFAGLYFSMILLGLAFVVALASAGLAGHTPQGNRCASW